MTTHAFWRTAPWDARLALLCGAALLLFYPASLVGLRLEHGIGNWGTLALFPLVALGFGASRRHYRLQRAVWQLSGQGKSSSIMATLEARPPARPRWFTWLVIGVAVAASGDLLAAVLRHGSLGSGAETRLIAGVGVVLAIVTARRADTIARREAELRRWEAAVAA